MDLTQSVDIYCERIGAAFWAEPVNAITNLAFLLAAFYGWRLARRRGEVGLATGLLIALAAIVGVGSFLFHTFAQRWAGMADVIPIGLFSLTFAFVSIRRFFRLPPLAAGLAVLALVGAFAAAWRFGALPAMGGTTLYTPAVGFLVGMAVLLALLRHPAMWVMAAAALTFLASLYFRGLDHHICEDFPLGVHFLWHILNGLLFALLLRAAIVHKGERT